MHDVREYLLQWKRKDKSWKFQKSKQNWIVRNIYVMDKELFKMAIKYLKSGSVKPYLIENAKAVLDQPELPQESEEFSKQKKLFKRARKVLRLSNK